MAIVGTASADLNDSGEERHMGKFQFWTAWLLVVCFTLCAFGLLMIFFGGTTLFSGLNAEIEGVFWPGGGIPGSVVPFRNWLYGAWGATITGFGVLAALVGGNAFGRHHKWARDALAGSLAVWYILDTGVSLLAGVRANAMLNSGVLALFILPLAFTWGEFAGKATSSNRGRP
jgi:hypothetical protein